MLHRRDAGVQEGSKERLLTSCAEHGTTCLFKSCTDIVTRRVSSCSSWLLRERTNAHRGDMWSSFFNISVHYIPFFFLFFLFFRHVLRVRARTGTSFRFLSLYMYPVKRIDCIQLHQSIHGVDSTAHIQSWIAEFRSSTYFFFVWHTAISFEKRKCILAFSTLFVRAANSTLA